jgi:uncharacterized membrane protein YedE/YeeE
MKKNVAGLLSGILFGLGLSVSQMSNPNKVLAFLDIAGHWDPSLIFVMLGAILTLRVAQQFILKRPQPLYDSQFHIPSTDTIDPPLILGATLFGLGWGMAGFCPGSVLAALSDGKIESFLFTAALCASMMLFRRINKR